MKKLGFSLTELFVSIALILLIFTIGVSRFSFFNFFVLKNEISKLFNTTYFLQQKAISSNRQQDLFLDEDQNLYFYFSGDKKVIHKFPNTVKFGFLDKAMGPPAKPQKQIQKTVTFKQTEKNTFKIRFFPDGACDTGTIYLVDKDNKYMFALTSSVSKVMYFRKYKYVSGRWEAVK